MRLIDADKIVYYESIDADTLAGTGKFYAPRELIDAMPTIEERKTGHWILHSEQENIFGAKTIECSECGDKCLVQFVEKEKYCRNCGSYNGG